MKGLPKEARGNKRYILDYKLAEFVCINPFFRNQKNRILVGNLYLHVEWNGIKGIIPIKSFLEKNEEITAIDSKVEEKANDVIHGIVCRINTEFGYKEKIREAYSLDIKFHNYLEKYSETGKIYYLDFKKTQLHPFYPKNQQI